MNKADLKKKLTPEQYNICFLKGTEPPFSGKYTKTFEPGMYKCVVCGRELFSSSSKFDSKTGWPSFDQPVKNENITFKDDYSMGTKRIEVMCKCGSHLGHVFDDGPTKTGKRFCINSLALEFIPDQPYIKRVEKPWGYELHWVPEGLPYMGKVLHIKAGCRISLQIHDKKQESWFLMKGQAKLIWENAEGDLVETKLQPGFGYTCYIGQKHRLAGITDCDIIEASTPELGNTFRLEDDYSRPTETEEMRKEVNRGWK